MKETRLLLEHAYANGGVVSNGSYEVEDAHGRVFTGTLDETGRALVVGLAPGPARVRFGDDPANSWDESSYFGTPAWPTTLVQQRAAKPGPKCEVPS
ncbi:TPA: hypothetical protein U2L31_004927 [Burkholderia contaminans]|nr:hypothetical protein [Burkholderia contaminans]